MLERFKPHTHENPIERLADTIVVEGKNHLDGDKRVLDETSRFALLTAGILLEAGIIGKAVIRARTKEELLDMERYMDNVADTSKGSLVSEVISKAGDEAGALKRIVEDSRFGEVALLKAGDFDEKVKKALSEHGIKSSVVAPEEEISKRIVDTATSSPRTIKAFLSVARLKGLKMPDIKFIRLSPAHST